MAQQTSVEWLDNAIKDLIPNDIGSQLKYKNKIEQAKEMEKQQIIDAVDYTYNNTDYHTTGLLYYNETFKK